MLKDAELDLIAQAVAAAEANTSGEVYCLVTPEAGEYREVPIAWAAAAALLLPPLAVLAGWYGRVVDAMTGWSAAHAVSDAAVTAGALTGYAVLQAVVFGAVWLLTSIPAVRRALTPGWIKTERVRKLARQLFIATGMKDDPTRTGVLIFAAFAERRVELLADEMINKAAEPGAWDRAVQAVVAGMRGERRAEGFVQAVSLCGDALARAFPGGAENVNRLSDRPTQV